MKLHHCALLAAGMAAAPAHAQDSPGPHTSGATIVVIAPTPLPGTSIDADKIAGEVQKLSIPALTKDRRPDGVASLLEGQLASVSLSDEGGSRFQPDFSFRGFTASPVAGVAEGLVVYQDGVRLNEAFGDAVNWDLLPAFAMRDITIQSNNPAFGLNALGGAVTIAMKDGFTANGASNDLGAELSGGSFGAIAGHGEYARRLGDYAVYLGAGMQHEAGWRYHSPMTLRQAYGDLGYAAGPLTLHLSASGASNSIDAVGPTPAQMLEADPRAVFTWPQTQADRAGMVQLRGSYAASANLTLDADVYLRRFTQSTVDGNTTNVTACQNARPQLCLQGAGQFPADALYDSSGAQVPASVLPASATPGEIDTTHTGTTTLGATLQAAITTPLAGLANALNIGAALDQGTTAYAARAELGMIEASLAVVGSGVIIDQALSPSASPPILQPVSLRARNTYVGLYAIDVLDATPHLSLTLSGRWNGAQISLADQTGGSLTGTHDFARFNPGAGAAWRISPGLTAYAGYAEANRAPTAGELSCADPTSPCPLAAFLESDPPLKQVVAHSFEAGLRGHIAALNGSGTLSWNISAFHTLSSNDILLVATQINGFGYFRNAGSTRRQGLDANLRYHSKALGLRLGYSLIDATFRDSLILSSNSPSADANGLITVSPGDRLPLTPRHRLTLAADYALTPKWTAGLDLRWQSSMILRGDESNQQPPLSGLATVGLRTGWTFTPGAELFADVENLLAARTYTYGAFTGLDGLPPSLALTDPRSYSPGEPRSITLGARLTF